MNFISHLVPLLELGVGPSDLSYHAGTLKSSKAVLLDIAYEYTAPRIPAQYLPNGDPGDEPGEQEELAIVRIQRAHRVRLRDYDEEGLVAMMLPGFDLLDYMTDASLTRLELDLLKIVRSAPDQARLDAYLTSRA